MIITTTLTTAARMIKKGQTDTQKETNCFTVWILNLLKSETQAKITTMQRDGKAATAF